MPAQKEYQRQYLIVIVAVVLLVLVGLYVGYGWMAKPSTPASEFTPISTVGKGTATPESKKYNEDLKAYNSGNADKALNSGGTYVSALSTTETKVTAPSSSSGPAPGTFNSQRQAPVPNGAAQYATYGPPQVPTRKLSKEDEEHIQALFAQWAGGSDAHPYSTGITNAGVSQEDEYASSMQPVTLSKGSTSSEDSASRMTAMLRQQIVVQPYSVTYGLLLPELDTDESSLVRVQIPDGMPFGGAVLFAQGYKLQGEDVSVDDFDAMLYQGHAYKIDAKPLDPKTGRSVLAGDVKHHYFARIVLPALANGIGNTAQMFATAGSQNVVTPEGSVISTNPTSPSARNIAGSFVGGAGQSAGQVLTSAAAQIPATETIVHKGEMIGIQFIGSVTAADDMAFAKTDGRPDAGVTAPAKSTSVAAPAATSVSQPGSQARLPGGLRYTSTPMSGTNSAL